MGIPGRRVDLTDLTPLDTARREFEEEVSKSNGKPLTVGDFQAQKTINYKTKVAETFIINM